MLKYSYIGSAHMIELIVKRTIASLFTVYTTRAQQIEVRKLRGGRVNFAERKRTERDEALTPARNGQDRGCTLENFY